MNDLILELPYYIKPLYSIIKKKSKEEVEARLWINFKEMLVKIQMSISFNEIFELILKYAKFIKEFLFGKKKKKVSEHVDLTDNPYREICQTQSEMFLFKYTIHVC